MITYYLVVFWILLTFYSAFIVVFSGRFDLNNLALGNRNKYNLLEVTEEREQKELLNIK